MDQVRQMKHLQEENARLKQLVAELSLDKTMLQDMLRKKFWSPRAPSDGGSSARTISGERVAGVPGSFNGARHISI